MLTGRDDLSPDTIPADEPVFVIRGRDKLAPSILRFYATEAARAGASVELQDSVLRHAEAIELYQQEHGSKLPDMPSAG